MGVEILHPQHCPSFRRCHPHHTNPNPNPHHTKPFKKRRQGTSRPSRNAGGGGGRFVMDQVRILKRGESLPYASSSSKQKAIGSLISDPKLFGPVRLGPGPDLVAYAGSAFSTSPSPGSLPLPRFSRREGGCGIHVDRAATNDIRRLLRLD